MLFNFNSKIFRFKRKRRQTESQSINTENFISNTSRIKILSDVSFSSLTTKLNLTVRSKINITSNL